MITSHPHPELTRVVAGMKARWSQENHLKYMRDLAESHLHAVRQYGDHPIAGSP